jgi:hypothetical protein
MIAALLRVMSFAIEVARIRRLILALLIVVPAVAHAASGTASLTGTSKLAVKGCGRDRGVFSASLTVAADGTWSTQVTGEERIAGTYTTKGHAGRKLVLTFDAATAATLAASIASDVTTLCQSEPATVTSSTIKVLTLTLDRKLTKATLLMRATFTGSAGGRSGTATYKVLGRGPWTPG